MSVTTGRTGRAALDAVASIREPVTLSRIDREREEGLQEDQPEERGPHQDFTQLAGRGKR